MIPRRVRLVPVGPLGLDAGLLPWLARELRARLGAVAEPGDPLPLQEGWFDARRGQFRSNDIVDALIQRDGGSDARPGPHSRPWTLGITEADLFAEQREFVFGEAAQGGDWALLSLARLRAEPASLLRPRALKEALHELGHLAGLEHCHRDRCVMLPSALPADVDAKDAAYCAACRRAMGLDRSSAPR